jgi:rubrerythrin
MERVRRYGSLVHAEQAAAYLNACGIPARVVGHAMETYFSAQHKNLDVMVLFKGHKEKAGQLLDELEADPAVLEEDWEDEAAPDLSQLDPQRFAVACPGCGQTLPMDESLEACPTCDRRVDVARLIVERHGPEALMDAYDEPRKASLDVEGISVPCGFCGYELIGLDARGRCPECGSLYDKDELLNPGR